MESKTLANGRSGNYFLLLIIIICSSLLSCSTNFEDAPIAGQAVVVSVSSDGNYAITSHVDKKVILWDIQNKTKKIISRHANIYSAYFIKNTHLFIWQDLKDIVHVQDIHDKEILSFHNFPTYGQVMTSDLKSYFSLNKNLDLYEGYRKNQKLILTNGGRVGFLGDAKLLNLTLSTNNRLLLTSGLGGDFQPNEFDMDDGVILWDVNKKHPLLRFIGNEAKTIATLSPEGKYVVSGDENGRTFIWNTTDGKLIIELDNDTYGKVAWKNLPNNQFQDKMDYTGYPPLPDELRIRYGSLDSLGQTVFSLKFIDLNGHYLRFTNVSPYAVLYHVNSDKPLKYIPLGKYPWPFSVDPDDYSRDQCIDAAPNANILVVAQANGPGIIVYKFNTKNFTLQKIWAPDANHWHLLKMGMMGILILILFAMIFQSKQSLLKGLFIICGLTLMIWLAFSYFHRWDVAAYFLGMILGMIFMNFPPLVKISKKKPFLQINPYEEI